MLQELATKRRVAGLKETRRAVERGVAARVFLARDADPLLTEGLRLLCLQNGIVPETGHTMLELGHACALRIGTAAVAIIAK